MNSLKRELAALDAKKAERRRRRIAARETQRTLQELAAKLPDGWNLHLLQRPSGAWVGIEDAAGKCRLACGVADCGEHLDAVLADGVRS